MPPVEVLSDELLILLEEAADMKWPFVPEKWQYKHSLTSKDKVNLKDLISENLTQLLVIHLHEHYTFCYKCVSL